MGKRHSERQVVVGRSPQDCFDALVDFESYPRWQRTVKRCEVLARDREGRGRRVSFEVDAKLTSMTYTLDYSYEPPHLLTWRLVEGDVRNVDGEFVLEDRGDGTTLATCAMWIDPGASLPGKVASALSDHLISHSVEDLKARVESGA